MTQRSYSPFDRLSRSPNGTWHWAVVIAMIALLALSTACQPIEDGRSAESSPRLGDIRSRRDPRHQPTLADRPSTLAVLHRYEHPLASSIDQAWALTKQDALPKDRVAAWAANGIRVATISRDDAAQFFALLGPSLSTHTQQLHLRDTWTAMMTSASTRGAAQLRIVTPLAPPREERFTGGRFQLLARIGDRPRGHFLGLLPHWHKHQPTIRPRTPQQKTMDGKTFDALTLHIELPSDQVLVITTDYRAPQPRGLNPKGPIATDGDPNAASLDHTGDVHQPHTKPDTTGEPVTSAPSPLAEGNTLGRALLTANRYGWQIRTILLIDLQG